MKIMRDKKFNELVKKEIARQFQEVMTNEIEKAFRLGVGFAQMMNGFKVVSPGDYAMRQIEAILNKDQDERGEL